MNERNMYSTCMYKFTFYDFIAIVKKDMEYT